MDGGLFEMDSVGVVEIAGRSVGRRVRAWRAETGMEGAMAMAMAMSGGGETVGLI
jgi:hypothetical protein